MKKQFQTLEISVVMLEKDIVTASGLNVDIWFGNSSVEGTEEGGFYEN